MKEKSAQLGDGCAPTPFNYFFHHVQNCGVRSSWECYFAPNPPPPSLPSGTCLSSSVFLCVAGGGSDGEGEEGVGDRAKSWPSKKSSNTLYHRGKSYKDDIKARCIASLAIRHSNHWFGQIRQKQFLFLAEVNFRSSYFVFPLIHAQSFKIHSDKLSCSNIRFLRKWVDWFKNFLKLFM